MKRTEVCSEARGTAFLTILGLELNPRAARGGGGDGDLLGSKRTPDASGNCHVNIFRIFLEKCLEMFDFKVEM